MSEGTTISFSGPIEVTPELSMALWDAMPPVGQSGTAQLYFARFIAGPISDAALAAGAKVMFERCKIPAAAEKAMRAAVGKKCAEIGEKSLNPTQVRAICDDETRKAVAEYVKAHVETVMSAIPLQSLVEAALPSFLEVVRTVGHNYFMKMREGQEFVRGVLEAVKADSQALESVILEKFAEAAKPMVGKELAA